jgi:ornithine--oxo-acid transaminase
MYKSLAHNSWSLPFIIKNAKGSWIMDIHNTKYFDAFSSYSSVNFGHCHPTLRKTLIAQSKKLSVFSRTSTSDVLLSLCDELYTHYASSIPGNSLKVVPMNSGVEAGETAVKLARKWGYLSKKIPLNEAVVVFPTNNYWGRTISAISTSDYEYQKYFYPPSPGFCKVPYNDIEAMEDVLRVNPNIAAVFLEPIQGEGGINVPSPDYFKRVRELCDKYNVLLICDEIQTGMGRTGSALCIQDYDVKADMILLGKSLGGGFVPFSVCMARSDIADLFKPGEHSSTFGGFPLGCKIAYESLKLLHSTNLLETSKRRHVQLLSELTTLKEKFPHFIKDIRGKGMLWGIELTEKINSLDMIRRLLSFHIVTREANNNVIRVCPPLTSTDSELLFMIRNLENAFNSF